MQRENDFNTFMFNIKDFDRRKFTKAVLCIARLKVELELIDLDEDSDSDTNE